VLAGLELLGVPYELKHVNYFTGAHKQPDYLAIIRMERLPAAKDGDFALSESCAILQYAADLSGSDKAYPKDLKKRADVNRWMLWKPQLGIRAATPFSSKTRSKPLMESPAGSGASRQKRRRTGDGWPASSMPVWQIQMAYR